MKTKIIKIMWGVLLISLGGVLLANQLGYISFDPFTEERTAIFFAILSAAFSLTYFLRGMGNSKRSLNGIGISASLKLCSFIHLFRC